MRKVCHEAYALPKTKATPGISSCTVRPAVCAHARAVDEAGVDKVFDTGDLIGHFDEAKLAVKRLLEGNTPTRGATIVKTHHVVARLCEHLLAHRGSEREVVRRDLYARAAVTPAECQVQEGDKRKFKGRRRVRVRF